MSLFSRMFGKKKVEHDASFRFADPIDAFWAWWSSASVELARAYDTGKGLSDDLVEQISEHVHAMNDGLAWETGPGRNSDHHFALSSEGDAELRVLTERWLSRAPERSKSWEYYAARQASGADSRRTLRIGEREFGYSDFKLALERDDNRAVVDVGVYHPLFPEMDPGERLQPTFLFLDDVLGEDGVTSWVGSIDALVEAPDSGGTAGALLEMVQSLKAAWDDQKVSLLQGTRDDCAVVAVVRLALKRLDHLLHDHHLKLCLTLRETNEAGLNLAEEGDELNALEDELIESLGPRAVWIGHETFGGQRVIHFHADSSPTLQDEILKLCDAHGDWEKELKVAHDPSWSILKAY